MGTFNYKNYLSNNPLINEETTQGLITFEQLKTSTNNLHMESLPEEEKNEDSDILNTQNMDELLSVLDQSGYGGDEKYDFIFSAILK